MPESPTLQPVTVEDASQSKDDPLVRQTLEKMFEQSVGVPDSEKPPAESPINEGADNLAPFSDATTVPSIDLGIESPTTTKTTAAPAPTLDSSPPSAPRPQPIRVNGGVQQANLISVVQPVYPPEAKRARILGVVVLEAVIDKDGTVDNLKVITGHPLLIQAAIDAVKQWRYKPTLLNGELVPVVTTVTLNFTYK